MSAYKNEQIHDEPIKQTSKSIELNHPNDYNNGK